MPPPTTKEELRTLFERFGAKDPELLAASQVDEGIPQLVRFLFMKAIWDYVPREGDSSWIDRQVANSKQNPSAPFSGLGAALALCRDKGVLDAVLTEMARCLQAQMIHAVGYVIDGPSDPYTVEGLDWALFEADEEGRPFGGAVSGLHESVLEFDPTGRELRPPDDA